MKKVIIVHQWMAGANADWRPWLKSELEKRGIEVVMPEMPDIDTPVIDRWVAKLSEVAGAIDSDTYFVGHSIGCQTILRFLETLNEDVCIGGAVFVAGWFNLENLEDKETVAIADPWINTPMNLEKIKKVLPKSALLISDNDPFGMFEENKKRFLELGSEIIILPSMGHFMEEGEGCTELPEIVSTLEKFGL